MEKAKERAKEKLTNYWKPMLVEEGSEKDLDNPLYVATLKCDGTMAVVERTLENGFRIYGKRGLTFLLPELENLAKIPHVFRVIGEIVYIDSEGHQVWRGCQIRCQISNRAKVEEYRKKFPIGIFLFDITHLDGFDLTNLPFFKRWNILKAFLSLYSELLDLSNVRLVPISADKRKMFEWAIGEGLEGVVLRSINGIYESGKRSKSMIKCKVREHSIFTLKTDEYYSHLGTMVENE